MNRPVLVVEDDLEVSETIQTILESAGLKVIVAQNGAACLEELKKGFKGLILLDVMMPKMNGWNVVKAMVNDGYMEGNIICMLTASSTPDPMLAEYGQYVLEYIRKPFDPDELTATVKCCLSYLQ